ncbi:heavy-metal-associated domain-containing protein [Chitinophaga barathri]|uniref:Cation transporter n=1 Tax=Chitinophaga barathri TaxID=1647451 RepID=A0A3N4MDF4_9BACT|nr:heavy-metal-associated domain-containing protein [Chitinophaga barathri]RPD41761.1 cation transporter [Chitinophaga barathri]
MKKIFSFIALSMPLLAATGAFAQAKQTDNFKVYGNCEMCKERIEQAATLPGVRTAVWDVKTKQIKVTYDPAKVKNETIQQKIAAIGHDTEKQKAPDAVYNKLPECCLYERK